MDCWRFETSRTTVTPCVGCRGAPRMRRILPHEREQEPAASRPSPRFPLQISRPEQKTQQLPLLFPHKPEHVARPQTLRRLARIRLHPPTQKLAPPRRQPMPPRRIPKKPHRSKHSRILPPSVNLSDPRFSLFSLPIKRRCPIRGAVKGGKVKTTAPPGHNPHKLVEGQPLTISP